MSGNRQSNYFRVPNKCTVSNNHTGWDICPKSISKQDLISAQAINKTKKSYKVKKTAQARFSLKLISAQDLISPHRIDFFFKKISEHVRLLGTTYFCSKFSE